MKLIVVLSTMLLFLSGCSKKKEEVVATIKKTDVVVSEINLDDITDYYTLPGVAEAWEDITVPAEISGPITNITSIEGQYVKMNDPILRINSDNVAANLNTAKVQHENEKKEYLRQTNLFKQKAVSQKQFDEAKKAYDLSIVNYKLAQDEFEKSLIKSPIDGIIDEIAPSVGEYVSVGTVVARIVDLSKVKIYVNIPENNVKYLSIGQTVDVYVAENNEKILPKKGIINFISVVSDSKTLTHRVRVDVDIDKNIRPGRIVRVSFAKQTFKNSMIADMYSVIERDGKSYVFVNKNGVAEERQVVLGEMIGKKVILVSGVEPGEEIVVKGQQFLKNGSPLNVVAE